MIAIINFELLILSDIINIQSFLNNPNKINKLSKTYPVITIDTYRWFKYDSLSMILFIINNLFFINHKNDNESQ